MHQRTFPEQLLLLREALDGWYARGGVTRFGPTEMAALGSLMMRFEQYERVVRERAPHDLLPSDVVSAA